MSEQSLREVEAEDLKSRLEQGESLFLLDVRTPEECADWRIEEVVNIPIDVLLTQNRPPELPKDREIVTICSHGDRSLRAADLLLRKGFRVKSLKGGMAAWNSIYDIASLDQELRLDGQILQIRRLGKGCISYVVFSEGQSLVIDPTWQTEKFLRIAEQKGAVITHVVDTHQHADHVSGARRLAELSGATLYLNPDDGYLFTDFEPAGDGDNLKVGTLKIRILHAPGHTRGSILLEINDQALFTGDILFVEGVGRPDLRDRAQEFAEELYNTIHERLLPLSDDMMVLPGHYSPEVRIKYGKPVAARLGHLRQKISLLRVPQEEFIAHVTTQLPGRPPNAQTIVQINRGEKVCDLLHAEKLEEGPNRCAVSAG